MKLSDTETYNKVMHHRLTCSHWQIDNPETLCLECFGGGLTKFVENLFMEMKKKGIKIEDFE